MGFNFNKLTRYLRIWWLMSRNSFLSVLSAKLTFGIFFFGKIFRFVFFIIFLRSLVSAAGNLAGYSVTQALFFFLTFNLVEVIGQCLFREVYRFRGQILSGDFDLTLIKPINPLFKSLMGGADVIDLVTIPPVLIALIFIGKGINTDLPSIIGYITLVLSGLVITAALYIFILSIGVITTEVEPSVMIFRDISALGRLPVDIYREPIRSIITYLIPIGIMYTIPAKAFFGQVNFLGIMFCVLVSMFFIFMSQVVWKQSLKRYASASS